MTTKTIPAYLEDERQKDRDSQLQREEEATRIHLLHHRHYRAAKQPKLESLPPIEAKAKAKQTVAASGEKSRAVRKTVTKARKRA
jgi:hypothetical protein